MFKSGTLFDLIGNLSLMAATYPRDGLEDKILKIALYLQTRQGEESLRARQCLVNLRDIIHGLVKADRNGSEVAQRILAALRKNGERFLSAMILRNHMYSFGMIDSQTRRLIPQFISKDQLAIYIQEDRQKLSDVITEGFWQDRAASSSVFYLLEQSGSFDKKLRKSLAEQIKTPEGIVALAAVFCPPGIVIGREAVQRFVDLDLVEEMLALAKPISRYHQSSIENLRETVREEVADT